MLNLILNIVATLPLMAHLGGDYAVAAMKRLYPAPEEKHVEYLLSTQREDGSWPGINYDDRNAGKWDAAKHAKNVASLAMSYLHTGNERSASAAILGMRFWFSKNPSNPNWWNIRIYAPKLFGPAFLALWDMMDENERSGALEVMSHSELGMTGQNKVNMAYNVLVTALLTDNERLLRSAYNDIVSEIRISEGEGLQKDYSYHQHGHTMQTGNYGLGFADNILKAKLAFQDSPLELSKEKLDIANSFVKESLRWLVWGDCFDLNVCGRQVGIGRQTSKASAVRKIMEGLDIPDEPVAGAKYYPCSDFCVYRTGSWYASLRMQSKRIRGFECNNEENMAGYFTSDGALLVRRSGDEFKDIVGGWNPKHIPGTTTYDDGKPLWGFGEKTLLNRSGLVFAKIDGDCMAAGMDLDHRDGLKARKSWFFWEGGIVCLGAGITKEDHSEVVTTLAQCHLRGEIEEGDGWVRHDGVTYVILDGSEYEIAPVEHVGSWKNAAPYYSDDPVTMPLFDLYISHGGFPKDASYAYAVLPGGQDGKSAYEALRSELKIVRNSWSCQEIRIGGRTMKIDWIKERITIK